VASLLSEEAFSLLNLDHQIVPNGLRDCAARVVDFALNCVVPSGLNNLLTLTDSGVNVLTEGLHDLGPLLVHRFTHQLLIIFAALSTLVTSGEELSALTLDLSECSISDQISVVFNEGLGN